MRQRKLGLGRANRSCRFWLDFGFCSVRLQAFRGFWAEQWADLTYVIMEAPWVLCYNRSKRLVSQQTIITQARDGVGLDQGKRWSDSGFILKIEQTGFVDWLGLVGRGAGQERRQGCRDSVLRERRLSWHLQKRGRPGGSSFSERGSVSSACRVWGICLGMRLLETLSSACQCGVQGRERYRLKTKIWETSANRCYLPACDWTKSLGPLLLKQAWGSLTFSEHLICTRLNIQTLSS